MKLIQINQADNLYNEMVYIKIRTQSLSTVWMLLCSLQGNVALISDLNQPFL